MPATNPYIYIYIYKNCSEACGAALFRIKWSLSKVTRSFACLVDGAKPAKKSHAKYPYIPCLFTSAPARAFSKLPWATAVQNSCARSPSASCSRFGSSLTREAASRSASQSSYASASYLLTVGSGQSGADSQERTVRSGQSGADSQVLQVRYLLNLNTNSAPAAQTAVPPPFLNKNRMRVWEWRRGVCSLGYDPCPTPSLMRVWHEALRHRHLENC
ncbi:hypothetical protein T492DRAFT_376541 [Pavlovales sp. CCMP2436]|nr:hypothetical protein T492DRAFT_376541 [Pavlovales sp. CCMP2436]